MITSGIPAVTVLVVAYRADAHLEGCLTALGTGLDVIVVDNDAGPGTRGIAGRHGARYLTPEGNVGFAAAVNLGLSARPGSGDVLLLNPDARIGADDLQALQAALHAAGTRHAAVGPRLVDEAGVAQRADWPLPSPGQVWFDALGAGRRWRGRRFVTGAVLLLSGQALDELGGLDERYFLYAEEADWQQRAQRAGWSVAVVEDVTAIHVGGASSSDPRVREGHFHASGDEFARRWYSRRGVALMRAGSVVAALRRSVTGPAEARRTNRRALGRQLRRLLRPRRSTPRPPAGRHVVQVVRSDGFAGVERYIVDTAAALHELGWTVTVIGGDPARMRAQLPGGIVHHDGATTAQVARALWHLRSCDIVHAHMTAAELPAALLKGRLRARLVVTRHFAAPRGRSPAGRLARPCIAARVDRQIAISDFVAASLGEPSIVVRNGVSPGFVEDHPRTDTVVVLSRLQPEKDVPTALRAWALSGLGTRGWRLVLHGRGAAEAELRALSAQLGIEGSVEFAGFTDRPREELAAAAMTLATAVAEPFGLAVVESMAEGTPVVASDGGAHRETLGEHGLFFAVGDAHACAEQLRHLAASATERSARGARLRERQISEFSLAAHARRLESVYVR